jgi:diaminohydroxyphosphoribosylaminopyrimidine deaminase / 5-amino-6-(5-phosphoribosylamino)uracil reductase
MTSDAFFLKQTLQLAKKGQGWTHPNPMVGAVIVKNGKVIGAGYHKKAGDNHAEIEALKSVNENPKGSTIYVNLEPCSHFGKTPPCANAIIKAGITRVVCCTLDPNLLTKEKGKKLLEKANIAVSVGELEKEARELNEIFFFFHEKKRPFIALKFAASLDGKIATYTHDSKWITNEKARTYARDLRSHYQSILVGINTIIKDDPHLGVSKRNQKEPIRIILDSSLRIPRTSHVLRDTNVILVSTQKADKGKKNILQQRGIEIITSQKDYISLQDLREELTKREITNLFVEGGSQVLGSFVDAKLVDKVYAFHSPIIIGGQSALTAVGGTGAKTVEEALRLERIYFKRFDETWLTTGYTVW